MAIVAMTCAACCAPARPAGRAYELKQFTYGKEHRPESEGWAPANTKSFKRPLVTAENEWVAWLSDNITPGFDPVGIIDEHGCKLYGTTPQIHTYNGFNATAVILRAFPRRQKVFTLNVYEYHGERIMGTITVTNPAVGPFPEWVPQAFPIRKTAGDLSITLKSVTWRTNVISIDSENVYSVCFEPDLTIVEQGKINPDWSDREDRWEDPTGNHAPYLERLCKLEPVLKLKSKLYRAALARFPASDVWSIPNLPVMSAGTVTNLSLSNTVHGVSLRLFGWAGPGTVTYSNGVPVSALPPSRPGGESGMRSVTGEGSSRVQTDIHESHLPHFAFQMEHLANHQRVAMRIVDQKGRQYERESRGPQENLDFALFDLPRDATTVTIEFIVQNAREVEFVFKAPKR